MKKKIIVFSFIGVLAVGLLAFGDAFKASEKNTTTYQPIVNEDTVIVTDDELK